MRYRSRWVALTVVLVLAAPLAAADQKKNIKATDATEQDYKSLQKVKELSGKLLSVDGSDITVQIEYQTLKPNDKNGQANRSNQKLSRDQQQILRLQQQIQTARRPSQQAQLIQRLNSLIAQTQVDQAKAQQSMYKVVTERKNLELEMTETVKVRVTELPIEYDDKGRIREYTAAEKKEKKGPDPKLPGYTGERDNLAAGQMVKIYLAKKKTPPKASAKPAAKEGDKDPPAKPEAKEKPAPAKAGAKDKDLDEDKLKDKKPLVTMILITKEPENPEPTKEKKGKKKNK